MKYTKFISIYLALITFHGVFATNTVKPNVVLIMADDFGWGDPGQNNPMSKIALPAIDRIAKEGIRFTEAYTPHSVCTPTRYALLTGRYCWRTHVREGVLPGYAKSLIPSNRMTLGDLFQKAGYRTAVVGKWHIGLDWPVKDGDPGDFHWGSQILSENKSSWKKTLGQISQRIDYSKPISLGPLNLGFDTCFITPSNNARIPIFIKDRHVYGDPKKDDTGMLRDIDVQRDTVDDIFVEKAINFMKERSENRFNQPFFLYLALNAPHAFTKAPKRFLGKSGIDERADKCLWVNESVGKVLQALEEMNIEKNTIVIFTSDNGPIAPQKWNKQKKAPEFINSTHAAAGPYRGYKSGSWDGGVRVPLFMRWPGKFPAGTVRNDLISLTDFMASFSSFLNVPLQEWAGEDSFDQWDYINGESTSSNRDQIIIQSYIGVLGIRHKGWKLIINTKGSGGSSTRTPEFKDVFSVSPWDFTKSKVGQLYNLEKDPFETTDLFEENPEMVKSLVEKLQKAISEGRTRL